MTLATANEDTLDSPADKPHVHYIVQHSLAGVDTVDIAQRFFIALVVAGGVGFVVTFSWMWLFR